jgi:hypothetical protein
VVVRLAGRKRRERGGNNETEAENVFHGVLICRLCVTGCA